jgi:hypothetical protein
VLIGRKALSHSSSAFVVLSISLFWFKPVTEPEILADEIIENIVAGLANFRAVAGTLASKE